MAEENDEKRLNPKEAGRTDGSHPEPPPSWNPSDNNSEHKFVYKGDGNQGFNSAFSEPGADAGAFAPGDKDGARLLEAARKYITIAQVCAIVSLFIGGVMLSTVATVLAVMGLLKSNAYANERMLAQGERSALRRPAVLALGMSVFALVFNIVSLVIFYPVVMQSLQSGDLAGIFGSGQGGSASVGAGSSTWG